jgi:hypothetical protein
LNYGWTWYIGIAAFLACGRPQGEKSLAADSVTSVTPTDTLVLSNSAGIEVWFTLARVSTGADGGTCVERGLEIRHRGKRVKVPLLLPVLLRSSSTTRL